MFLERFRAKKTSLVLHSARTSEECGALVPAIKESPNIQPSEVAERLRTPDDERLSGQPLDDQGRPHPQPSIRAVAPGQSFHGPILFYLRGR
jgi:hypothetical protein